MDLEDEVEHDIVWEVTKQLINCIDEDDFNVMHKVTDTVYGFVNKPAILPDIVTIIDKLSRTNTGKVFSLDQVIDQISKYRLKAMIKSGLIDNTILLSGPKPGLSKTMS